MHRPRFNPLKKIEKYLSEPIPNRYIERTDIPIFAPRSAEDDKYDKDPSVVERYTGIFSFGYKLLNSGGAEGLYRTINSAVLSNLSRDQKLLFLDMGCGVGRTLNDLSRLFPKSMFIGMDYSYKMLQRAYEILFEGKEINVDFSDLGLGTLTLQEKKNHDNIALIQGNAMSIPLNTGIFDCVISTFLIDRVADSRKVIEDSIKMLKPGGLFVFADPLNFSNKQGWDEFGSIDMLVDFVRQSGIEILEWFDGLVYREMKDARGNYSDWETLFLCGIKQ